MLDFNKKIKNTNKFREPAIHFGQYGCYTLHKPDTAEYKEYWAEQKSRCLDGWIAPDGDYITGFHYFYLNFCTIQRTEKEERINKRTGEKKIIYPKTLGFPRFFDYDYYFFEYIEEAIEHGRLGAVAKARDRGYSLKIAAMCNHHYHLIPDSNCFVYTSGENYLLNDGTMVKCWMMMDFITAHTPWGMKRSVNNNLQRRASFWYTDANGLKAEGGYRSTITGISMHNNPDVVRGTRVGRHGLIFIDEAGSAPELQAFWQIMLPAVVHDGEASGFACAIGTGSADNKDMAGLKELFFNPEDNYVYGVPNIWDEGQSDTKCGFFCPQYANNEAHDSNGKLLYMDEDGNTLVKESLAAALDARKKKVESTASQEAIDRFIIENAVCPIESFQEMTGNVFNKKNIIDQLTRLRTNKLLKNFKQVGDLQISDNEIVWKQKIRGDIEHYPMRGEDPTGSIVIWEHPKPMLPVGTYILAVDSYDLDEGTSLGSCFVYKRYVEGEDYHSMLVAEYTGRPKSADEFYENVRRLTLYYNGRLMFENQNRGIYTYFLQHKCEYLLAEQPDILKDIITSSRVNRVKGVHMSIEIKKQGLLWFRDFLNEDIGQGRPNSERVFSEPLLEECLAFNGLGPKSRNVDRVSAMIVLMIYLKDIERNVLKSVEEKATARRGMFDYVFYSKAGFDSNFNERRVDTNKIIAYRADGRPDFKD